MTWTRAGSDDDVVFPPYIFHGGDAAHDSRCSLEQSELDVSVEMSIYGGGE
jgi:hypothetical protein